MMTYSVQKTNRGFVLILTMLIVALVTSITTYIAYRASMFVPYTKVAINHQKAYQLALSGVQLAISKISTIKKPEESADKKKQTKMDDAYIAKQLLLAILPQFGQLNTVRLRKDMDGLDGTIQFCITSEEGKLDINALYDYEKHRFVDENDQPNEQAAQQGIRALFKEIFEYTQKAMSGANLLESFENFLKQRQYKLDDVTELLAAPGFEIFRNYIFYIPPAPAKTDVAEWRPFFLTDLFTINSGNKELNPWLLSDSVRGAFGFKRVAQESAEKKESTSKMIQETVSKFALSTDWKQHWDQLLAPYYQKEYSALTPSMISRMSTKFESTVFSVVSYGTFANVTQRLYALLERVVTKNGDEVAIVVKIKKIYRI